MNKTIEELRRQADAMPYGSERVDLRRRIWRMKKELETQRELEVREARERRHEESVRKRRERRLADRMRNSGRVVKTSMRTARKDYECYGCGGECPIPKGDAYFAAKVINGGRIVVVRYCQRCHAAIESKLSNSKDGTLKVDGPGQFRWTRLSNAFRKRWTRLIEELTRHDGDRDAQNKAIMEFGNENRGR